MKCTKYIKHVINAISELTQSFKLINFLYTSSDVALKCFDVIILSSSIDVCDNLLVRMEEKRTREDES